MEDKPPEVSITKSTMRRVDFDYMKGFIIVLVVLHHSIMSYTTFSAFPFSPIVDSTSWIGFDVIAGINDVFFMSLMFLVSGLFIWKSLVRKGIKKFTVDRLLRLGLVFVIFFPTIIPLAFYTTQLELALISPPYSIGFFEFWVDRAKVGFGTSGPLWFIWLLLLFNIIVAAFYMIFRSLKKSGKNEESSLNKIIAFFLQEPLAFFGLLLFLSILVYFPMALPFGIERWDGIGPLTFQTSRVLLYFAYFLMGAILGSYGLENGIFKKEGKLAQYWWGWLTAGILSAVLYIANRLLFYSIPVVNALIFTITCASISFAVIAVFLRFAKRKNKVSDSLASNSYGIYIFHYAIVTFLQYAFLFVSMHAILKGLIVFIGGLGLSWGFVIVLRKIPGVTKVI